MASLWPLPDAPTSTSLALTFDLSVASASNPTELNAIGTVAGDLRLVHPTTATSDSATWYRLDASTDSVSAPYIMASATAGLRWIAIAGKYEQGGQNVSGAIVSTSTITGTQLISNIATGTAPLAVTSTTVVPNLNVSQLLGQTWANPGPIGGTTPATTFALSGILTSTNTTSATTSLLGAVVIGNGTAATSVAFGAGIAQIGATLTVGTNATFGNTAAGNTAINVNAATGNSAYFLFKVNNVAQAQIGGNATNPIYANDQIATTPWTTLTYTSGLVSAGYWTFPGTLDATSSAAAALVGSGGLAIAKSGYFGGGLHTAGACTLDTGANGSSFGGKLTVTGNFACNGSSAVAQPTGYGTPTGGALVSSFAAGSITAAQVAAELAQLIIDLKKSGIIGA